MSNNPTNEQAREPQEVERLWVQIRDGATGWDISAWPFDPREVHDNGKPVYEYVPASRDTGKWQAIETAPKGRDVLLLRANGKYVIGDWAAYEKYNAPTFTHWQSLPDPPLPTENPSDTLRE